MTSAWLDDFDSESYDDDDGFIDDSETDAKKDELIQARQQRRVALAIARRRALQRARVTQGRPPGVVGGPATPQQAVKAIRNLNLDSKVREDLLKKALADQNRRASRATYASVAGVAVDQIMETFPGLKNPYLKAGLRFAPLLLLDPQKNGTGAGAFIRDPRVIGGAAVAGILAIGQARSHFGKSSTFEISGPSSVTIGSTISLKAQDSDGKEVSAKWKVRQTDLAKIDDQGVLTGSAAGNVTISATADGVSDRFTVTVT